MRALVDIPEQDLQHLNRIGKLDKVSRAEVIRRAITAYIAPRTGSGIDEAFGAWADRKEDSQEYLEKLRREWER